MQGQRGAINSLPETLGFEHGSSSSDAGAIDQQICWNNNNINNNNQNSSSNVFMNSSNQEGQNISMWTMGEPGSSSVTNHAGPSHIEPRPVGWPALMKSCPEPHQFEPPASMLSLGDQAGSSFLGSRPTVNPSPYRGSSSSSFSDPFGPSSDPFELDGHGRRLTRKRKPIELTAGQSSSVAGSSNTTSDSIIPRLGLGVGGVSNENPIVENTHRNVRLRISSSGQQDPFPTNNNVNVTSQSNVSSPYPSLRLNPVDIRSISVPVPAPATAENPATHTGQPVLRLPALRRHLQSTSRWSRNSTSRPHRSLNTIVSGDRNEHDSRTMPTNISDHPLFIPPTEVRPASAPTEVNWSLTSGVNPVNGVASSSRAAPQAAAGNRGGSLHYPPRRLSEFLRRSLLSAAESEAGGGRNPNILPRAPAAGGSPSQDNGIPLGVSVPGHHQPHSRSSILVGRQLDAALGFPYLSRAMTAGNEGRGRLVSEIRNVLDLMRRGEPLRFEDVMILDQSVFYGVADIHDRHRDMRLDIDNMSYEELLALEERIGNVNTGLTEETILKHLKQKLYVTVTGQPDAEPCCICQDEYKEGEDLGALNCGHDFHHCCIKQWLLRKNSCPICKSTAFPDTPKS